MMNRIFHARMTVGQIVFLILVGFLAVYGLWEKQILIAVFSALLLLVNIERLIHTTYTITPDGKLIVFFGRFSRHKEILLTEVTSVERASSMRIGRFAAAQYVLVCYGQGKHVALLPIKEAEFIRLMKERMG